MLKNILFIFFAWRFLLFIPLILGNYFLQTRAGYDYVFPSYFGSTLPYLLSTWGNFDGVYYLIIAAGGYTVDNSVFFPLFPLLVGFVSSIFGQLSPFDPKQITVALILVSIFLILALSFMHKLVLIDYKKEIAFGSILFMLLFPTSFFFASIYTESLFLFLTILSFYFARRRKWFLASISGLFLTATRFVGIAIIPALIYEFYITEKKFSKKVISLFLVPIGILGYAYFNFVQWGNALHFAIAQENLQNQRSSDELILIPQTLFRYFKILTTVSPSIFEWWIALLELSALMFAIIMLFVAWKMKIRFSYILFSIFALLIPVSTGTLTGMPRYILILFPIFIALAIIKNKLIKVAYVMISLILLAILLVLFSKGYYIS